MHEIIYSRAALPVPATVMGLVLRPYSLGHVLFLMREQNPLLTFEFQKPSARKGMPGVTKQDLAKAALICCQTYRECADTSSDLFAGLKVSLWRARLRIRGVDFRTELMEFIKYRNAGSLEIPMSDSPVPEDEKTRIPRTPGAPFVLRLHQFLVTKLSIGRIEAWDYPWGLAKIEWQTFWESEGAMRLYNPEDAEFDRYIAEREAEFAAKEGK
jgi:hypothetical protein